MFRNWWFILAAMLQSATLYRNRLRAYLEVASANVRAFDLPSAEAYDALAGFRAGVRHAASAAPTSAVGSDRMSTC